jgi:hypothetical protein
MLPAMPRPSLALRLASWLWSWLWCLAACAPASSRTASPPEVRVDDLSQPYVKLILAMGTHDPSYVDAYYGPERWREEVEQRRPGLDAIRADAARLREQVRARAAGAGAADELERLRLAFLDKQLGALLARADVLAGKRLRFDDESRALYDAVAPVVPEAKLQEVLDRLDQLLPGAGPLAERMERLRRQVVVPRDRLQAVFDAAIAECRARTLRHIQLPEAESFTVEYVKDKPWSAYNWYKGGYRSVIQVNVDLPVYIDRAIDLACHEGYPGHHVYNALLEEKLVHGRGWTEFTVYPLFSPMSLIAEGSANHGIDVAFPGDERAAFEQRVLYPLAGLDPALAAAYERALDLLQELKGAGNNAARRYLDGEIDAAAAAAYLTRYTLAEPERAKKSVRFIDAYRSYVINYNVGKDLVAAWVEREAAGRADGRWDALRRLLASPRLAADLR